MIGFLIGFLVGMFLGAYLCFQAIQWLEKEDELDTKIKNELGG